jgi:hypothetical protein
MEIIERDHYFSMLRTWLSVGLKIYFFWPMQIAGFDGLNLFSYVS